MLFREEGGGWRVGLLSPLCTFALWPAAVQYSLGLPQGQSVTVTSERSTILNCVRYGRAIFKAAVMLSKLQSRIQLSLLTQCL